MIRRLFGTIVEKSRNQLVIDVGGVGYDVFVTPAVLTSRPTGDNITLHISESIREDGHDLYGFDSEPQRQMFERLRKVSGIGPKASLAACAFFSADELQAIISSGDAVKLSLVPGIGQKTAEKVVLELKDKVAGETISPTAADVVDALLSLGYSRGEIASVIAKIPKEIESVSQKVSWVLRNLVS